MPNRDEQIRVKLMDVKNHLEDPDHFSCRSCHKDITEVLALLKEQPNKDLMFLARNIVNQLFDKANVDVDTRQRINDECDNFVLSLLQEQPCKTCGGSKKKIMIKHQVPCEIPCPDCQEKKGDQNENL